MTNENENTTSWINEKERLKWAPAFEMETTNLAIRDGRTLWFMLSNFEKTELLGYWDAKKRQWRVDDREIAMDKTSPFGIIPRHLILKWRPYFG